jgi:hypothetical protein
MIETRAYYFPLSVIPVCILCEAISGISLLCLHFRQVVSSLFPIIAKTRLPHPRPFKIKNKIKNKDETVFKSFLKAFIKAPPPPKASHWTGKYSVLVEQQ